MLFNVTPEITFSQLNAIMGFDKKLIQVNAKL